MGFFNVVTNEVKAAVGYQQNFTDLLTNKDVGRALTFMYDSGAKALRNLEDYNIETHKVMKRMDKAVYDKKGNFLRWQKRWKIPIPYQKFINEIALVFLYGRPVKWIQKSENTDDAFNSYKEWMEKIRFDAAVREAKRIAGAEGTSAILWHCYKNDDGNPDLLLNVLGKSKDDDIFFMKDQYKRLVSFAWGYTLTDAGHKTIYHVDIYTKETIYRCTRQNMGWKVLIMMNPVHKIPVTLFEQEPECDGVQPMIERTETLSSVDADVNDRFANPAMVATAQVLNDLPKAEEEAKLYILKDGGELKYLTWDQASQSKKDEYDRLDKHIMSKTFTPDIDLDTLKGLGNISAKALNKIFLMAQIKADKRKETHDGYMNRVASLMCAILGNVLDYTHKAQYDALEIGHEFQQPFGEDVSDTLADVLKQYGAGALSLQSTVELSYLVKNSQMEMERIKQEQAEALQNQQALNNTDVFGGGE